MKLELPQIRHVAKLARLSFSTEEESQFVSQLSDVLNAVEKLAGADTEGVAPTTFAIANSMHTRPDDVCDELPVEVALKSAPHKVGTSFAIPKVIE